MPKPAVESDRGSWYSEESSFALRTKQLAAAILPRVVLLAAKKRYYASLLRQSTLDSMEKDATALPRIVRPADFVIDIGAFVGFYSKPLSALVGPSGKVWSFEPSAETFEILSHTIHKLGLTNVEPFNYAISDCEKMVMMEVPRYRGGGESWYDTRIAVSPGPETKRLRRFPAQARTLDSLTLNFPHPVSFIKCDAEYHELYCMRGAVETLRRYKPAMLIEMLVSPDTPGSDPQKTVEFLRDLGYEAYRFDGNAFHRRKPGENSQNYFFFSDNHRAIVG